MNLEQICAEALERLAASTQRRIDEFKRYCDRDAEHTRRSMGQKARRIREELQRGR